MIQFYNHKHWLNYSLLLLLAFTSSTLWSQNVNAVLDKDSILIGEEIKYHIQIKADSSQVVILPEGQTFAPLEMINSYPLDTINKGAKNDYLKTYGITQFDSGYYYVPPQKIIIGSKHFSTDTLKVRVNPVVVDTTKQKLYDIKPIMAVTTTRSYKWLYITIAIIGFIALLAALYWFVFRKKSLTEEEKIALLPPYDRAKLAVNALKDSQDLEVGNIKEYYSKLTLAIRQYLDEKVYDHALESTTQELIQHLQLLKSGNQLKFNKETLENLESIFQRADLVKFAKSAPDIELAKLDQQVINTEIDTIKELLPEPSEEEKLLNETYRKQQERKLKVKRFTLYTALAVTIVALTYIGFGVKNGFRETWDTVTQKDSKQLLENNWVKSKYGFPSITISTPKVLKRIDQNPADSLKQQSKISLFNYNLDDSFSVTLLNAQFPKQKENIDIAKAVEAQLVQLEKNGATNIISSNKKFKTPNGAEGLETTGTLQMKGNSTNQKYTILSFSTTEVLQQVMILYNKDDVYLDKIYKRIIESIELKPKTDN